MIVKENMIDQITILEDGQIQIREVMKFVEDGEVIAISGYHRRVVTPDDDIENEDSRIKALANVDWSPERKAKFRQNQQKNRDAQP